jgi:hypothetical protein
VKPRGESIFRFRPETFSAGYFDKSVFIAKVSTEPK